MKIEQITKAEHDRRIVPWYQRAINDSKVHPFLSTSQYRAVLAAVDDDWSSARFMDDSDRGLLLITLDRERSTATIGLWVLGANTGVAAGLMLYAIRVVPKRFGVRNLSFSISDSNVKWRDQAMRVAGGWMWGREPGAVYDTASGTWVDSWNFKVPVSEIQKERNDGPR